MKSLNLKLLLVAVGLGLVLGLSSCGRPSVKEKLASPDLMYLEAQRHLRVGNFENAIFIYEQLQIAHPFSEEAKQAQIDIVYAYFKGDQPEAAVDAADQFIRENPRHPNVDYAYYLKGLVYFPNDRGLLEKVFRVDHSKRPPDELYIAFANFSGLVQRFPDSEYAPDARERMIFLRNRLAKHELGVAKYYMKRGAFVAAAGRAKFVIDNYQGAPGVQEALLILTESYRKLGLDELAHDSERVLLENYPDQKFVNKGRPRDKLTRREPAAETAPAGEGSP